MTTRRRARRQALRRVGLSPVEVLLVDVWEPTPLVRRTISGEHTGYVREIGFRDARAVRPPRCRWSPRGDGRPLTRARPGEERGASLVDAHVQRDLTSIRESEASGSTASRTDDHVTKSESDHHRPRCDECRLDDARGRYALLQCTPHTGPTWVGPPSRGCTASPRLGSARQFRTFCRSSRVLTWTYRTRRRRVG